MNLSSSLVLVSLSLSFVSCEKCSEALHEAFKSNFDVSEKCDDCVILPPLRTSFRGENWAGFCVGNQLCLFRDWKCRGGSDLLNLTDPYAVVTNESCELVGGIRDFHENCLKMFDDYICNGKSGVQIDNKRDETDFVRFENFPTDIEIQDASFNKKSTPARKSLRSTGKTSAVMNKTEEKSKTERTVTISSTESTTGITGTNTSEHSTTGIPIETTSSNSTTNTTKIIHPFCTEKGSSNCSSLIKRGNCENDEYYFNGHCYFLKSIYLDLNGGMEIPRPSFPPNTSTICRSQHHNALGLAVETREENDYIMKLLSKFPIVHNNILTSGIRNPNISDLWNGWNKTINHKILPFRKGGWSAAPTVYYCIDACNGTWYMLDEKSLTDGYANVVCERPYNPKNIQLELHETCLKEYRRSHCYDPKKHADYCCVKDDTGDLWFSCPQMKQFKKYPNEYYCKWLCLSGSFAEDQPSCEGLYNCHNSYKGIIYFGPVTRYARSSCPTGYEGSSVWYCNANKTFLGTPDFSLCCKNTSSDGFKMCSNTDTFLNIWRGCPSKKVTKKTSCPPGMILDEALVEWDCLEDGSFSGSSPNYSNCDIPKTIKCRKKDRFNTEWKAEAGTTVKKNCPANFTGLCSWYCKESGKFDGPEPDCSRCMADWMNEITDKIKNQTNYEDVMEIMENYTECQDLTIGYAHVLNLTADCVTLFKKQVSECKLNVFEKFLKSYSKILKNVAGNHNTWSNFSELNRRNYSEQILETTQTAAFINLEIGNETGVKYNETFAKADTDGFDFFVAYNPSMGSQFPLENFSESDWHLDIKEINESQTNFAAMGLVMSYSLSSLMFPQGNQTQDLQINAPAITFKVAACRDGEIITDPNVVVSVSFKHKNRTRMPETVVIRRRLHDGEQPSGVYKSTLCFYYGYIF